MKPTFLAFGSISFIREISLSSGDISEVPVIFAPLSPALAPSVTAV